MSTIDARKELLQAIDSVAYEKWKDKSVSGLQRLLRHYVQRSLISDQVLKTIIANPFQKPEISRQRGLKFLRVRLLILLGNLRLSANLKPLRAILSGEVVLNIKKL